MITATYMAFAFPFRPEFASGPIDVDITVQPIDAPERLAAGSHVQCRTLNDQLSYAMPSAIDRVYN